MTLLRLYWIALPAGANLFWRNLAPTNGAAAMTKMNHIDPGRAESRGANLLAAATALRDMRLF